ncbi:sugar phosphate isomerase/epimerase family protein [Nonomuraea aridisoli]|uniref:Protein iolH n=1 Tax=Nonomuraea aridisoli TaxID=2070368 RepID=A0A2W2FJK2_9ACTN|nr:sugar phosphate isomerase/epimerase [Nonomuraea aridisoli]PZG15444.1 protein iolH [Nonomuraea aridisoli]
MKIALDPAMMQGRPVVEAVRATADAGYRHLEMGNRDDFIPAFKPMHASPAELRGFRDAAATAGVEIASVAVIQAWSSPDEDVRKQAVEWWKDGIAAAVELGCRRINTELSGHPEQPDACRAAFLRSFEELLPVLEREDVELIVEPHPWDFIETTVAAVDLVKEAGSARLRYLHCVPHTYYLGGGITEQVEYARGFDHVHLADAFRPERTIVNPPTVTCRVHQHFDLGRGEIDWAEVRQALESVGFDGILTVQIFGWDDQAEQSFKSNLSAVERLFGLSG